MIRPELDPIYVPGQQPESDDMFKNDEEKVIARYAVFYLAAVFAVACFFYH